MRGGGRNVRSLREGRDSLERLFGPRNQNITGRFCLRYTKTQEKLIEAMVEMDIIDCHEHLPPEHVRTDSLQDVFTLFSHHTGYDLVSAGMGSQEYESLVNHNVSPDKRWQKFRPYWQAIRFPYQVHLGEYPRDRV